MSNFEKDMKLFLGDINSAKAGQTGTGELYHAVSRAALKFLRHNWEKDDGGKRACYFSAEFLMGRMIYSNLLNLGLTKESFDFLSARHIDPRVFEEIDDYALGSGGLGRLAACFLDSAATHGIKLDGYGLRYRYGLFKQTIKNGFQKEEPDDWQRFGDPWSIRREEEAVLVEFADQTVRAVPYDMPVIGYGGEHINTLRLWQAEAVDGFDLELFNRQQYDKAVAARNRAEDINAVLYPSDDTPKGKKLRLKQQYFFASASIQSIVSRYVMKYGSGFDSFADTFAIQLNDTHPVIAIPELLRILVSDYHLELGRAFEIVRNTFAYTNHTVMAEALEKWDLDLFLSVVPAVYPYVVMINDLLKRELFLNGISGEEQKEYRIIDGRQIHMARLAVYSSHSVNGVAEIHTGILKSRVLRNWYELYPERFNNKTNGITQRRWLALANPELSAFITEKIGNGWLVNLEELEKMLPYAREDTALDAFIEIKETKKRQLCEYIEAKEGIRLDSDFVFDVQIKRLHEYKRQLLNAFSIMDFYFGLKDGSITSFHPTVFLFGAKAAPGYKRAKGIIKYINEVANLVNGDAAVQDKMKVIFVSNYNVSYAEKIIPAAELSEQISTAGTEASGTGNMKLMLNGAVTLGTMDGANIEIVREAGLENNFIFGARAEELDGLKSNYDPVRIYRSNPRIKRVLDTLTDGTFSDGKTGIFEELYTSILEGASWHDPDVYKLVCDFESYCDTRLKAINASLDRRAFAKMGFINMARAGKFSSDRTVKEYDRDIWHTRSGKPY
ncbi:MAG TPA: glycogen phosphorylase [Ruminiclostridium sp.]|nr:glycogen phosphorylase [Ruminiclostridium sp.]